MGTCAAGWRAHSWSWKVGGWRGGRGAGGRGTRGGSGLQQAGCRLAREAAAAHSPQGPSCAAVPPLDSLRAAHLPGRPPPPALKLSTNLHVPRDYHHRCGLPLSVAARPPACLPCESPSTRRGPSSPHPAHTQCSAPPTPAPRTPPLSPLWPGVRVAVGGMPATVCSIPYASRVFSAAAQPPKAGGPPASGGGVDDSISGRLGEAK